MAGFGKSKNGNDDSTLYSNNTLRFYGNPKNQNLFSETSEPFADLNNPATKTRNRCETCKKKVGLLGFNCRCGGSFCSKHRHPEEHSCVVDHKAIGREILANQIVECKADKLDVRI